jgi:pseudouridine-5'-phosphate glycosidase
MDESTFVLSQEVIGAILNGQPIVALESTVISHGLPRPDNLETAQACEAAVRRVRAVPATLAVFDGRVHVGCTTPQLERLAASENIQKLSIRDLPVALARRTHGATTVATSVYLASIASMDAEIEVFATGGIGGVHRGWQHTLDISADLPVLAQTGVAVVCAGAKSILDLPATREWLETAGITVVGWQTDEFPAFYSRESGLPVDVRVETAAEAAAIIRTRRDLGLPGTTLVCVPVPPEYALPPQEVETALHDALRRASDLGITGKALTPFLLSAVAEATYGRGLEANKALLVQNARVAAEIAVALQPRIEDGH